MQLYKKTLTIFISGLLVARGLVIVYAIFFLILISYYSMNLMLSFSHLLIQEVMVN